MQKFLNQINFNANFYDLLITSGDLTRLYLKNFYKNTNGAREKIALLPNDSFSGKMKGDLNMRQGRLVVNEIIGNNNKKFI